MGRILSDSQAQRLVRVTYNFVVDANYYFYSFTHLINFKPITRLEFKL